MDAEKHVREKERLNQALNGNLDKITEDIKNVLTDCRQNGSWCDAPGTILNFI